MATVQLKSEVRIDLDEFVGGVSQLETPEIENLLSEISLILARRKVPSLPARESHLLQRIGEGLSDAVQQRYAVLQRKLLDEKITLAEHQELLRLIDVVEQSDSERLEALIELAQLRQVELDELMSQLGIHAPRAYA